MGVYLPTASLGNSRMLASFGGSGEIMAFFAPRVDFAQNIRECLAGVWLPDVGRFAFLFDDTFAARQRFQPGTNILRTDLRSRELGLDVELTDLAPLGARAIVRRVRITSHAGGTRALRFISYFRLALGECDEKNAVHYLPQPNVMRQLWRDYCIAVAVTEPFAYQCGKVRDDGSQVKWDMVRGFLSGQEQDIGRVDFALGSDRSLLSGTPWEFGMVLAFGQSEQEAVTLALELRDSRFEAHASAVASDCRTWLSPLLSVDDGELREPLQRALLDLRALADRETGAMVAAPEFDPMYELSGGYGYCWPRDSAEVCRALEDLGETEIPRRALDWCRRVQLPSGHWYQRYWSDGSGAPSWCVYTDFYQLDQTCSAVWATCEHAARLNGPEREELLAATRPCVERAVLAIRRSIASDGLHETAADLWEVHRGSFTYTNAAAYSALLAAKSVFGLSVGDLPARIKRAVLDRLWMPDDGRFARGLDTSRGLDRSADSSVIGVFDPYGLLDLSNPRERAMAVSTLDAVASRLRVATGRGPAILRFEHESYMGGGPAVVNTLWFARAHLRVALAMARSGSPAELRSHADAAMTYIRTALAHVTPAGHLPELIPWNGYPWWAAPHGWASALLVQCATMLRALRTATGQTVGNYASL